ncbi:MAG TPA: hypothetical protein VIZ32_06595, partial [Vicinamibacterales bacterium]
MDDRGGLTGDGSMGTSGRTPVATWRRPVVAAAALVLVGAVSGTTAWIATRASPGRVSRLAIAPEIAHALA